MSKRFALFLFAFWCPLMWIGGPVLGEHFAVEFRELGTAVQMAIVYMYLLIATAPLWWSAFFRKSK